MAAYEQRSKRPAGAGSDLKVESAVGPPPSCGDGDRGGGFVGAARRSTSQGTGRMQRCHGVHASIERLVAYADGLNP
jgi:hypothetical protein